MAELTVKIDEIVGRFRQSWMHEHAGAKGVERFVSQLSLDVSSANDLLVALACCDLEQSWQLWCDHCAMKVQNEATADEVLERWHDLPHFTSYESVFADERAAALAAAQLAQCESACRDRWGDAIGPLYFRHYFRIETEEWMRRTRRHLRCEFETNAEYSQVLFPLRGFCEIGRQRSTDKDAYFFQPQPDGNRVVIANRYEAEISRQQLSLQLVSPDVAVITNLSRINAVRVLPSRILKPGDRMAIAFPFTMVLPGRRLFCY